jgi:hypothetical protein
MRPYQISNYGIWALRLTAGAVTPRRVRVLAPVPVGVTADAFRSARETAPD